MNKETNVQEVGVKKIVVRWIDGNFWPVYNRLPDSEKRNLSVNPRTGMYGDPRTFIQYKNSTSLGTSIDFLTTMGGYGYGPMKTERSFKVIADVVLDVTGDKKYLYKKRIEWE
jgi:hypothetical protein